MNLKNIWSGNVSLKGVTLVAVVSLVVGLGISGSLDWLSPSRAVNLMGESGNPEPRSPGQLPDFVGLVKKIRPVVVNISTTQVSETRGGQQEFGSPFGEEDPFNDFWKRFFRRANATGTAAAAQLGVRFCCRRLGRVDPNNNDVVEECSKDRSRTVETNKNTKPR